MRFWYLSHRRPAKAQASLRIHAVSPEPSLFAHMRNGCRQRIRPNIRHLAPTGWLRIRIWRMNDEKCHNLMTLGSHCANQTFWFLFVKDYIGTQEKDVDSKSVLNTPGSSCYWPFYGGGPGVVLILCDFVVYSTGRLMLSLALLFVLVLLKSLLAL